MIFDFPNHWVPLLYDDKNSFYRKKFKGFADSKCIDIAAISPDRTLWLIEVKDYRVYRRKKEQNIYDEIKQKVRDTLACVSVGAIQYQSPFETRAAQCQKIRVVFHLEQPQKPSKFYPQIIDWANGTRKLKQELRVIDPHAVLCNMNSVPQQKWKVIERRR